MKHKKTGIIIGGIVGFVFIISILSIAIYFPIKYPYKYNFKKLGITTRESAVATYIQNDFVYSDKIETFYRLEIEETYKVWRLFTVSCGPKEVYGLHMFDIMIPAAKYFDGIVYESDRTWLSGYICDNPSVSGWTDFNKHKQDLLVLWRKGPSNMFPIYVHTDHGIIKGQGIWTVYLNK